MIISIYLSYVKLSIEMLSRPYHYCEHIRQLHKYHWLNKCSYFVSICEDEVLTDVGTVGLLNLATVEIELFVLVIGVLKV